MATKPADASSDATPSPSAPKPSLPKTLAGLRVGVPVLVVLLIAVVIGWNIWLHAIGGFLTAVMIELGKLFGTVS
jgi:hypothetical protein